MNNMNNMNKMTEAEVMACFARSFMAATLGGRSIGSMLLPMEQAKSILLSNSISSQFNDYGFYAPQKVVVDPRDVDDDDCLMTSGIAQANVIVRFRWYGNTVQVIKGPSYHWQHSMSTERLQQMGHVAFEKQLKKSNKKIHSVVPTEAMVALLDGSQRFCKDSIVAYNSDKDKSHFSIQIGGVYEGRGLLGQILDQPMVNYVMSQMNADMEADFMFSIVGLVSSYSVDINKEKVTVNGKEQYKYSWKGSELNKTGKGEGYKQFLNLSMVRLGVQRYFQSPFAYEVARIANYRAHEMMDKGDLDAIFAGMDPAANYKKETAVSTSDSVNDFLNSTPEPEKVDTSSEEESTPPDSKDSEKVDTSSEEENSVLNEASKELQNVAKETFPTSEEFEVTQVGLLDKIFQGSSELSDWHTKLLQALFLYRLDKIDKKKLEVAYESHDTTLSKIQKRNLGYLQVEYESSEENEIFLSKVSDLPYVSNDLVEQKVKEALGLSSEAESSEAEQTQEETAAEKATQETVNDLENAFGVPQQGLNQEETPQEQELGKKPGEGLSMSLNDLDLPDGSAEESSSSEEEKDSSNEEDDEWDELMKGFFD